MSLRFRCSGVDCSRYATRPSPRSTKSQSITPPGPSIRTRRPPPRIGCSTRRYSRSSGITTEIKRPKGWRGSKATEWLEPEQAFSLIDECYNIEPEFGLFCETLLYTGMRLGDATDARLRGLRLEQKLL
jgi:hypothetical protein